MKQLFGISQSVQRVTPKQYRSNKSGNKAKMLSRAYDIFCFQWRQLNYYSAAAPVWLHFIPVTLPVTFVGYVLLYILMVIIVESYIWGKQNVLLILYLEHK